VSAVDWQACEWLAAQLGLHTRELVAARDADRVRTWCLRMADESQRTAPSVSNGPRTASYIELAVLVGAEPPASDDDEEREAS
jgi:hypothetical protein